MFSIEGSVKFIYLNTVRFYWFLGALIILLQDKMMLQKKVNAIGTPFWDFIMKYLTHCGDGIFALIIMLVYLKIRIRTTILLLISFLSTAVIVQILKHAVFQTMKRPYAYLETDPDFRRIEDFTYHTANSFPSGHAASIFALCTVLAFQYKNHISLQIGLALFAITVAFTRVYLCQHFPQDIIAGSLIGTLVGYYTCVLLTSKLMHLDKPMWTTK